jgi:thiol-disulfide isomerase/thioredoxin
LGILTSAQDSIKTEIIPINDSLLKEQFGKSDKLYNLVVIYTDWCKPCREFFPVLIEICQVNKNIETYYVNPDPRKYTSIIKKYLAKYPEIKISYILDDSYKGSFKKRFISFKEQVYPQYDGLLGIPTVFILSKEFKQIDIIVGNNPDKLKECLSKLR